ncbi:hypothetical protein JW824_08560 [bacterium]|nr:hypothetical protein [bacterium]
MRTIGYLMISFGFLAGALIAVLDEQTVQWDYFIAAVVLGIVGILLVRTHKKRLSQTEDKLTSNIKSIELSLNRIVENMKKLNEEKGSIHPGDIRHRIDQLFPEDLGTFVNARESISHLYGLQAYTDVMSDFAAGERYLNRVWSASADGYIDEVFAYLEKAQIQFSEAYEKLKKLNSKKGPICQKTT